jgi:hypothetical protein
VLSLAPARIGKSSEGTSPTAPSTNPFKLLLGSIPLTQGHRHQRHSSTPSLISYRQDGKLPPSSSLYVLALDFFDAHSPRGPRTGLTAPLCKNLQMLTFIVNRFSRSTSSTPRLRLRPASTSLRYETPEIRYSKHTAHTWTREMDWVPEHRPSTPMPADEKEPRHRKTNRTLT